MSKVYGLNIYHILVTMFLTQACATDKLLDTQKSYRKTLRFEVNGEKAKGIYTAKKNKSYHLEISTPQKPSLVKITSCHQERVFVKPGKELSYEYKPYTEIEANDLPCIVEISVLSEEGKNQWGILDFQLDSERLPARVACNGDTANAKGSYVCQSREGLIQEIEFSEDVYAQFPEGCNKITHENGSRFFYQTTEGMCFYIFSNKNGDLFRLVTYGYNEIILDD